MHDRLLVEFWAMANSLMESGCEQRLMVAVVQLQYAGDHTVTLSDKLDAMVAVGLLAKEAGMYGIAGSAEAVTH